MNRLQKNFREGHSRNVTSNQDDVHRDLVEVVRKHQCSHYRRPIASFSEAPFAQADDIVRAHGGPVILDSGCGSGESSFFLAASNPEHLVIAIDKSAVRIGRGDEPSSVDNLHIIRGNCIDFWRLAAQANWPVERHFLLYPTPWPKAHHLLRRWHGHPVFSALLELGGMLELRSNWAIYINEFALALATAGVCCDELGPFRPTKAITAFERKYLANNHELFRLIAQLGGRSGCREPRAALDYFALAKPILSRCVHRERTEIRWLVDYLIFEKSVALLEGARLISCSC